MAEYEKMKAYAWRVSAIGAIFILFAYLLYATISDERWIFNNFSQAAILGFIIIMLVLYLLRNKKI
jgi:predicted acyltransferase